MSNSKKILVALTLLFVFAAPAVSTARANGKEYEAVVKHLKTKYQAKKVNIPMIWLARFAVRMVRPAGVKSFSITTFENLKFTRGTLDTEMQTALNRSFSSDWSPVFRVRSRNADLAYMYMREAGKDSIKIMLVTISENQATVIRAAFSPDKLADFINEPKIFGVSLEDKDERAENKPAESKENTPKVSKPEESKSND